MGRAQVPTKTGAVTANMHAPLVPETLLLSASEEPRMCMRRSGADPATRAAEAQVYDLPSRFQNKSTLGPGHDFGDFCQQGSGPATSSFEGLRAVWTSNPHRIPTMLHYRLLSSPQRTFDVDEADVFFITVWEDDLVEMLMRLNPKLRGFRHLLSSGRNVMCDYMYEDKLRSAVRIVREIMNDRKNRWNQVREHLVEQCYSGSQCSLTWMASRT